MVFAGPLVRLLNTPFNLIHDGLKSRVTSLTRFRYAHLDDLIIVRKEVCLRIGIIGTGIAGLTAGWLFKKNGHEVVMFEKLSKLGMSAHAVTVPTRSGPKQIDVPPRMFNEAQWPNLVKLYDHLGVQYEHVCLSKSFRRHDGKSYLNLDSSFKPKMKVSLLSNKVRRIVADAARLMEQVTHMDELDINLNFRDFLTHNAYSEAFVYEFLYPTLSSTVCTCSYAALDKYPARTVIEALVQIIGTDLSQSRQLMRTSRGTADVARRLSQDIDQIRFDTTVVSARRSGEGATVVFEKESRQSQESFDHLIVATQANQAIRFLTGISQNEARLLNSFHYEDVDTIVHTDRAMMPSKISNWSHFNWRRTWR